MPCQHPMLLISRDIVHFSITGQLNHTGAPPVEITSSVTLSAASADLLPVHISSGTRARATPQSADTSL